MPNDIEALLDDLLCRWHHWARPINVSKGHGGCGPIFRQYRASRQNDDENGSLDEEGENAIMRAVDVQIHFLDALHHIAICTLARALAVGASVWNNPRLPQDARERAAVVSAARMALIRRLVAAGVV